MTREQEFMLQCLRAYCDTKKLNSEIQPDYSKLFTLSRAHNLAPVVFSVIKDTDDAKDDKEAYSRFEDTFYDAIVRYDVQKEIISDLDAILCQNQVTHVFFKGAQIKELFPIPELRAMSDVDVLINQNDRDKVKAILLDNGYQLVNSNGPVYDYRKNDMLVEMHTKIISGKVGSKNAEEYFLDAIEHTNISNYSGYLTPEYHFMYLITHIAHHFWFYGAGVKMILDLAILQKIYDIDLDNVIESMAELELNHFTKLIISVCYKWFGYGKDYGIDTKETEAFLLNFGAFGNMNRNKSAVVARKALEEGDNSTFDTKRKLLFPSYKKMKDIPYMRFMEDKPYLLPIGWMYRIIYNLKNRKSFMLETTSALGNDETKVQAQKELKYFEEIGLL